MTAQMQPKLQPQLGLCAARTSYFHPWVDKVAQVVPNDTQSASKGVQKLPKWSQNVGQGVQNVTQSCSKGVLSLS